MSELVVRPAPSRRRTTVLTVLTVGVTGHVVARVEVARSRHLLRHPPPGAPPHPPMGAAPRATLVDAEAWNADAASRAAAARWADAHPAVRTVHALAHVDARYSPAEVIASVSAHLSTQGVKRVDVRVRATDPLAGALVGPRWVQGRVGADVVASCAVFEPHHTADHPAAPRSGLTRRLPPRLRRTARRIASLDPRQVPELVRTAVTEITEVLRSRHRPGAARSLPARDAPPGSHPFAASRYRTVRAALALVPEPLRTASFVDVGCGDGRVLHEALRAGFSPVYGRELDPELAQQARAVVGGAGLVEVGDALAVSLPDDAQVLFLNNPFDRNGLARFGDLVAETLDRNPRPLLVVYLNPRTVDPLLAAGLVLVHVDPRFCVLGSGIRP